MIVNQLGIFGQKEADENLVLASLFTGERGRPASRYVLSCVAKPYLPARVKSVRASLGHLSTQRTRLWSISPRVCLIPAYGSNQARWGSEISRPW